MESAYEMEMSGRVLSRTTNETDRYGYYPICGITNRMSEVTKNGKCKWAVRINALQFRMYIGICQILQAQ